MPGWRDANSSQSQCDSTSWPSPNSRPNNPTANRKNTAESIISEPRISKARLYIRADWKWNGSDISKRTIDFDGDTAIRGQQFGYNDSVGPAKQSTMPATQPKLLVPPIQSGGVNGPIKESAQRSNPQQIGQTVGKSLTVTGTGNSTPANTSQTRVTASANTALDPRKLSPANALVSVWTVPKPVKDEALKLQSSNDKIVVTNALTNSKGYIFPANIKASIKFSAFLWSVR